MLENLVSQGRVPTLAGSRCVLLQFTPRAKFLEIEKAVRLLQKGGYLPILAHIERYRCLTRRLARLKKLKSGCAVLCQMNCEALIRQKRFFFSRYVRRLLLEGLIDFVSTDAHDTAARACNMRVFFKAADDFAGAPLAEALTSENAGRYVLP
jgi:protein-tyrosine phosphatase